MRTELIHLSREDFRKGADRLHERLDGLIVIPDWVGLVIVGVSGGALPLVIWLIWKGTI